ncbi:MAG: PAS domain S-box protein [Deltaproteobacteria bacterium]|uniref:hybrid sensor histidine kinase/response regulator n=1 Tax=Hydrosulfovibrio ferrireducens TaxID=2934181 RepID=UPI0012261104|nr:MAG: PAS domain S-box protein [Deltaproteobacteria bacterium]
MKRLPACQSLHRAALSLLIACATLGCLLTGPKTLSAQDNPNRPHILILNSYHPGYLWSDGEQAGILETLHAQLPEAQFHIEYLDTKNFPKPEHYSHVFGTLAYKYKDAQFSVILAADNAALEFLAQFGKPLFGNTPMVFCGVSNFSPDLLGDLDAITGIVERHDVRSTIAAMLRLHPAAQEIYVVVDTTLTGKEQRKITEAALPDLKKKIKTTFTENLSIEEVLQQTRNLPPSTLVLILSFARDKNGRIFDLPELARLVSNNSPAPVYVIQEERMGAGVVGGYLLGGKAHGAQAAQLALRILAGESAASIPIVTEPPVQPMFDFLQLKRFGLKTSALPQGSIVINQPVSLYENYRVEIWCLVGFVFLQLCAIGGLLTNIQKKRQAEKTLGQHRLMLRQVLDMTPQSIFWKDREGVYLGCNAVFAKAIGLDDPEQIKGKTDFDLPWPTEEAEAYRADDQEVITSNRTKRSIIEPLQQANGSRIWIDTTKVPLQDKQGRVYGVLGVYEDVTEKKKREEQLYLAQFTIDSAKDSIFLIDEKAGFHLVNTGACRRLGYSKEELLALRVFDIDPAFPPGKWPEHWQELMEKGSATLETVHRTKEGKDFPVEVSATRVIYNDKIYDCAFARDISDRNCAEGERQRLEIQLRQSQKMEAIGTLAGGIAHDFNNILSIILGYTELAMMEGNDPEKQRQELDQVLKGAERAKELVQQILAFSRKTEHQKQPLQISLIAKEALKMLRASVPTTIEIKHNINSEGTVLADPTQIHQVIMNLCTNAYHAMRETGGILTISLDEVELGMEEYRYAEVKPGRYLRLEVHDTGCGIPQEIRNKIFEPYFTTKKQGEGTGMGLAVVHGIITSHHGHLTVHSEVGKGTSVHVYLPMAEQKAVPLAEKKVAENLLGHGERILVVDDEEQICDYLGLALQNHGYQVSVFPTGVEAWREFAKQPSRFDLVVTDMTMPYMTGAEFSQKVLSLRPDIPVILCTGHSALIDRQKARAMGICDYLNKPVTQHELLEAIQNNLPKK